VPASFKVYGHDVGDGDSEDEKHKYHEGLKVNNEE